MTDEPEPILTIYKTEDFTAQILTDERGIVLDMQITFKPSSEYMRRMKRKHYKQPLRVELPEDGRTNAMQAAGAWL